MLPLAVSVPKSDPSFDAVARLTRVSEDLEKASSDLQDLVARLRETIILTEMEVREVRRDDSTE